MNPHVWEVVTSIFWSPSGSYFSDGSSCMALSPQSDKKIRFLPFIDISDIAGVVNIKVKILLPL